MSGYFRVRLVDGDDKAVCELCVIAPDHAAAQRQVEEANEFDGLTVASSERIDEFQYLVATCATQPTLIKVVEGAGRKRLMEWGPYGTGISTG